jgi:hypothetical protein
MVLRNDEDDYRWVSERNLRLRRARVHEHNSPPQELSDKLVDLATVVIGIGCVIFLIDVIVTVLS